LELLGSTIFIRSEAAGTRGSLEVILHREAGAGAQVTRADPRAAMSREVRTGAVGTHGAPGAALRREEGVRAGPGAAPSRVVGLDTRRPRSRSKPVTWCPQSCSEPIYCWLFLVISS
jgi:hypothetical protein